MPDDITLLEQRHQAEADELARLLRGCAENLPQPERSTEFGMEFDRFSDAKIVLLGEATHGTSEFLPRPRRNHAAPDRGARLQHRRGRGRLARCGSNRALCPRSRAGGFGSPSVSTFPDLDVAQRGGSGVHRVAAAAQCRLAARAPNGVPRPRPLQPRRLDRGRPPLSRPGRPERGGGCPRRHGCLTPWQEEPADYGRAVLYGRKGPCEDEAIAQLRGLLTRRLDYVRQDGEAFFDTAQNARIARRCRPGARTVRPTRIRSDCDPSRGVRQQQGGGG